MNHILLELLPFIPRRKQPFLNAGLLSGCKNLFFSFFLTKAIMKRINLKEVTWFPLNYAGDTHPLTF